MSMRRVMAAAVLAVTILAACDQFSLFDELDLLAEGSLRIIPNSVTVDINGLYTFTAIGGTPPYDFELESGVGAVSLINATTGLYEAPASPGSAVVRLTDAAGASRSASVKVVAWQTLSLNPSSITLQANGSYTFFASGGTPPYAYSVVSGGGSVSPATGWSTLFTAPATAGTVYVRVTDAASAIRDSTVTVVSAGPLGINPTDVTVEQGNSLAFSAYGGTPGYTYTLTSGTSATLSPAGLFTALSSAAPGSTNTVTVTDSLSDTASATVTIAPAAPTNLVADGSYGLPTEIQLTWNDNATGESGYEIWAKKAAEGFVLIATTAADAESYVVVGSPNVPYTFKVRAVKFPNIYSAYSAPGYAIPNR